MTTEEVARELPEPGLGTAPPVAKLLDACDRVLEELGRRHHLFAWLRAPGAGAEEWLEVTAYYPSNRLVVVWHERPGPHDHVYSQLVPAHGFRLLELGPTDLSRAQQTLELALREKVGELGPAPRRPIEPQPQVHERQMIRAMASLALPAEPIARSGHRAQPRRATAPQPPAAARAAQLLGMALGLVLVAVLLVEVYGGVMRLGLDGGRLILAFGLALDACSRALGTIAAGRSGAADWAWLCALGGSPLVAGFALSGSEDEPRREPAPLAGLISLLAIAILALAALLTLAGS